MRLIDAEKYPCKTCGILYCHENCKKFYKWLDGCDYDVEKVIDELDEVLCDEISQPVADEVVHIIKKGGVVDGRVKAHEMKIHISLVR